MELQAKRNYGNLLSRIKSALNPQGELIVCGEFQSGMQTYPLVKIILGEGNLKRALISAGIHGDEPAGVETICSFLERKEYLAFASEWELTLLPCINPTGYELQTRENRENKDLNRLFKTDVSCPEVVHVKDIFERPYDLDLELHEDVDTLGYYLYQKDRTPEPEALGREILDAVEKVMALNPANEIEGMAAERGLISRLSEPDEMEWWPMAVYAHFKGCRHCFTLETSPAFSMETRVAAHLTALRTALGRVQN